MTDSTDAQLLEATEMMRLAQTPLQVALAEIERLRARIAELEAALHRRGTLAVTPETSGPIAGNYPRWNIIPKPERYPDTGPRGLAQTARRSSE